MTGISGLRTLLALVGGLLALTACALVTPPAATPTPFGAQPLVASSSQSGSDEPSPPGGLGNAVESFSRDFGRPAAAFGVSQPSYAYGQWPVRGLYVILDDSFRRAREVRINFGKSMSLVEAQTAARAYLPVDAKLIRSFDEPGTGDPATLYTSERLAAVFPSVQPAGAFVVVDDGQANQFTGLILRVGSS
jgi:hypothetical protein